MRSSVSAPIVALRLIRGVEREQPPVVDDRHPLAELVGLFHVVRGEHDRLAVGVELADDVPQREAALRVEARGRLVEEQHVGLVHDRPRHHQPLRHAAGELVGAGIGPVGQAELLEQRAGLAGVPPWRSCRSTRPWK